jgi:hypothetical protein
VRKVISDERVGDFVFGEYLDTDVFEGLTGIWSASADPAPFVMALGNGSQIQDASAENDQLVAFYNDFTGGHITTMDGSYSADLVDLVAAHGFDYAEFYHNGYVRRGDTVVLFGHGTGPGKPDTSFAIGFELVQTEGVALAAAAPSAAAISQSASRDERLDLLPDPPPVLAAHRRAISHEFASRDAQLRARRWELVADLVASQTGSSSGADQPAVSRQLRAARRSATRSIAPAGHFEPD